MEHKIIKINNKNYHLFDDMIYWRINGEERTKKQKIEAYKKISNEIINELKNPNLYIYSACSDEKMVGWISLIYMPKVGRFNGRGHIFVDELWVHPSFRNKGIATELMKKADELANTMKAVGIRLYANDLAQKLYERCGYNCKGSAIFMEK